MVKAVCKATFIDILKTTNYKNGEIMDPHLETEEDKDVGDEIEQERMTVRKHMRCFLTCSLRCTVDKDQVFIKFRKLIFLIVKKISKSCILQEQLKTLSI